MAGYTSRKKYTDNLLQFAYSLPWIDVLTCSAMLVLRSSKCCRQAAEVPTRVEPPKPSRCRGSLLTPEIICSNACCKSLQRNSIAKAVGRSVTCSGSVQPNPPSGHGATGAGLLFDPDYQSVDADDLVDASIPLQPYLGPIELRCDESELTRQHGCMVTAAWLVSTMHTWLHGCALHSCS